MEIVTKKIDDEDIEGSIDLKKVKRSYYLKGFFSGLFIGIVLGTMISLFFLTLLGIEYYKELFLSLN